MSVDLEKARTLIRVVKRLNGLEFESEGRQFLELVEGLLSDGSSEIYGVSEPVAVETAENSQWPMPIFKIYKHKKFEAKLESNWTVTMNGVSYSSPSNSATAITNTNVNGWRFWRYIDPITGEQKLIDQLRDERS